MSESTAAIRTLPADIDAELGLLGSIAISPQDVMPKCLEAQITGEHFYLPAHAEAYIALRDFYDSGKPMDLILLTNHLRDGGALDRIGGPAFLTSLFTFVPSAANVGYYIDILREKRTFRQAIIACNEFTAAAYEESEPATVFLDRFESRISQLGQDRLRSGAFSLKNETLRALESIEQLYERRGKVSGLPTGFADLDQTIDGLHPAEMIVIAARPSMGKTALAMNIAEHVAVDQKKAVGVFSLEMSTQQLMQRIICSRAKINLQSVRDGLLNEQSFSNMARAAQEIASGGLLIDDTGGLSILELRARSRRWKQQHDIQLIVIDYLQLLKSPSRRGQENRQIEIAEISSGIKALSKELGIPIVVLAQLNRNPEGRQGGRPRISDLRESGSIEQDADVIGLLTRPEYYAEGEEKAELAGQAELIIAKQRNGPLGDIPLTFLKQFARFESRSKNSQHETA